MSAGLFEAIERRARHGVRDRRPGRPDGRPGHEPARLRPRLRRSPSRRRRRPARAMHAVPGWRSVQLDRTRQTVALPAHRPRPRCHGEGLGRGPGGRVHLPPARLRRPGLARGRRRCGRPSPSRRLRHRDRRHLHRARSPPRRSASPRAAWRRRASVCGRGARAPGASHRGPGHRVSAPCSGAPSRRPPPPASRRTPHRRRRSCWRAGDRLVGRDRTAGSARPARRDCGVDTPGWPHPTAAGAGRCPGPTRLMLMTLVATVGHGSTALWYLTRATGWCR